MAAGAEFRRALSKRLLPLLADFESTVHRHGYLRAFFGVTTFLGTVGLVGQLLGVTWLRVIFATLAVLLFLVASAISFAGTQKLRERNQASESLLHEYADALHSASPIVVRQWRQHVTIEPNGDAHLERELVLDAATPDIPRHVSVNLVYYGRSPLTDRDRRLVTCEVFHAGPLDGDIGVPAHATSAWSTSANGRPKLDIYVHLGTVVDAGDKITVRWFWPKYSADLMSGRATETFDVSFTKQVSKYEHIVTFRDVESDALFTHRGFNAPNLRRARDGRDIVVRFSDENPKFGVRVGFVASYTATRN